MSRMLAQTTDEDPVGRLGALFRSVTEPEFLGTLAARGLLILLTVILGFVLYNVLTRLLRRLSEARRIPDAVLAPIRFVLRYLIVVVAVILSLQFAGVQMATIWAVLSTVVALIAVGFIAVWSVLSNLMCSLLLMVFKPFRIGDVIEIVEATGEPKGIRGEVIDLSLMYTVVRPVGQKDVFEVPNNIFFQKCVRRTAGERTVSIEDHVQQHGLTGASPAATNEPAQQGTSPAEYDPGRPPR